MLKIQALSPVFADGFMIGAFHWLFIWNFKKTSAVSYGTANFFGKKAPSGGASYKKRESSQILSC